MPDDIAAPRAADRAKALLVVCVLAVASVIIAFLGATPARVSSTEMLGSARAPGEAAFIASHRGGAATAPENTLPAVTAALAEGFDYVEVDVALTGDGHPVLMHDRTVDRTTDGHGALAALTLEEVRALDAGSWFSAGFAGTPVPTLAEFLEVLAASGKKAMVELKGEWDAGSAAAFVGEVQSRGLERHVAVMSFDARTLAQVAGASTVISRLAIFKNLPADIVEAARQWDVRGVVVHRRAVAGQPEVVDHLHAEGIRVIVYTLNEHEQWLEATTMGIDGIVTDSPVTLSQWQATAIGER